MPTTTGPAAPGATPPPHCRGSWSAWARLGWRSRRPEPCCGSAATASIICLASELTTETQAIGLRRRIAVSTGWLQDARAGRSPLWVEALAIAWICWLYDILTNLAPTRRAVALSHASAVLKIERTLGIDPELSLNRWLAGQHALALALSDYYDNAHFVVT